MKALPQAMAGANIHIGIMAGKLKGVMPAVTPRAWRMEYMSMPGPAASVNSPLSRWGAPMQNSTTSSPRWMSPTASGSVLPCSRDSASASLSMSRLRRSTKRMSTRARRCGLVAAQAGWALAATSTASASSAAEANGTRACTSPVAGLKTSAKRPERPSTAAPPMWWVSVCICSSDRRWGRRIAAASCRYRAPVATLPQNLVAAVRG